MIERINKLLFIGASLNIKIIDDFPNVKQFVFVDSQPRSKEDKYYFSDKDYNDKFIDKLLIIMNEYGFILSNIFLLDETYHTKILNLKKSLYYSFYPLPLNLDPELLLFVNYKTNQEIKYYISTNIDYNMNYSLLYDIQNSDALIINEYKPSIKLFEYFNKMSILIGYSNTNFSSFDEFFKDNFYKFKKYYLLHEETNSFIKCIDFMNMIIEKIKILNKNSVI